MNIHLYCYFNQRENRIILERKFLELKILTAILFYIAVVQLLSRVQLFSTLWTAAHQTSLSFAITQSLLKLMSIESVMPSNHLSSPSAFNLSQHQGLFQWVGTSVRWPKYWSFSFSISLPSEYSGLISFRIDIMCACLYIWASLIAQSVKNLPAMQETRVRSLGQEDPWRRAWQCTQVFLPGESHGQRGLASYSP